MESDHITFSIITLVHTTSALTWILHQTLCQPPASVLAPVSSVLTTAACVVLLKCQSRQVCPPLTSLQWPPSQSSSSSPHQGCQGPPSSWCLLSSLPLTLAFLPTPQPCSCLCYFLIYKALPQIPQGSLPHFLLFTLHLLREAFPDTPHPPFWALFFFSFQHSLSDIMLHSPGCAPWL